MKYVLRLNMDELTAIGHCINEMYETIKDNNEFIETKPIIESIMYKIKLSLEKDKKFMKKYEEEMQHK